MLALASLTKSVCVMHCGSADRSVPCRPMHVQASSIRAVLSAGGLRNERRFPEMWNAGGLGCDEVMGSGFTVAMKALGSRDNPN